MAAKFRSIPNHRRHHSWPPIRLLPSHLQHHIARPVQPVCAMEIDMDDNPFPYFLSSPTDPDTRYFFATPRDTIFSEDFDEEDSETYISDWMNANIEDPSPRKCSRRRRTRSVSPNGRRSEKVAADSYASAAAHLSRPVSPGTAVVMLRKWIDRMERLYTPKRSAQTLPFPVMSATSFPVSPPPTPGRTVSPSIPGTLKSVAAAQNARGRKRVRRSSKSVGNRAIRSYSGHVRVWREPAEDMYPLSEEEEFEVATVAFK